MSFHVVAVVVAEVHGEDVVRHVGNTVPYDKVGGEPVPGKEKYLCVSSNTPLKQLWSFR